MTIRFRLGRMSDLRLILCTAPEQAATDLARSLLEARLIGCANLVAGARSLYWWEGAIQDEGETVMLMECPAVTCARAVEALSEAHPYEVPKILVIDPEQVNQPYLDWLRGVASPK